jgi:hypothetical protein
LCWGQRPSGYVAARDTGLLILHNALELATRGTVGFALGELRSFEMGIKAGCSPALPSQTSRFGFQGADTMAGQANYMLQNFELAHQSAQVVGERRKLRGGIRGIL